MSLALYRREKRTEKQTFYITQIYLKLFYIKILIPKMYIIWQLIKISSNDMQMSHYHAHDY